MSIMSAQKRGTFGLVLRREGPIRISTSQYVRHLDPCDIRAASAIHLVLSRHAENNPDPISAKIDWQDVSPDSDEKIERKRLTLSCSGDITLDGYMDQLDQCMAKIGDQTDTTEHFSPDSGYQHARNCRGSHFDLVPAADIEHLARSIQFTPPLHFTISGHGEDTFVNVHYNAAMIDHRLVHHFSEQLDHIHHQICTLPGTTALMRVAFCCPFDRHRIMEWNSRAPPCIEDVVTDRIEAQVKNQPLAPAVCALEGDFTYQDLWEYSTRLAFHIREFVKEGQIVPLCFDKSAAAIISMIAVLKSAMGKPNCIMLQQSSNRDNAAPVVGSQEARMSELWSRVLGINDARIGRESDFFRSGGDSLAAMRLVAEAARVGIDIDFALISAYPMLKDLSFAAKIAAKTSHVLYPEPYVLLGSLPDLESVGEDCAEQCTVDTSSVCDVYPCTPIQEGLMSLSMRHPGTYTTRTVWNCAPHLDYEKFKQAWQSVYKANEILRTRIVWNESLDRFVQVVVDDCLLWTNCSPGTNSERSPEFGLGEQLIRCGIWNLNGIHGQRRFMLEMHHAIYDAFCMSSLLEQVGSAYYGQKMPPTVPYNAFVQYTQTLNKTLATEFWKAALNGFETKRWPLPSTDSSNMERCQYRSSLRRSKIQSSLKHTLPTIILASYASVLSRYTTSEDVCFNTTMSGRHASLQTITAIMGPTLTSFPFRISTSSGESPESLLSRVRLQVAETIPFEQFGMQNISNIGRCASQACASESMLIIQSPKQETSFDGLVQGEEESSETISGVALVVECVMMATGLEINADFNSKTLSLPVVSAFVEELCSTITSTAS